MWVVIVSGMRLCVRNVSLDSFQEVKTKRERTASTIHVVSAKLNAHFPIVTNYILSRLKNSLDQYELTSTFSPAPAGFPY